MLTLFISFKTLKVNSSSILLLCLRLHFTFRYHHQPHTFCIPRIELLPFLTFQNPQPLPPFTLPTLAYFKKIRLLEASEYSQTASDAGIEIPS